MKTITIGWINKCRCGNKSHTVKTARGNETALWDDDAVKCNSCGRGGVIQVCEGQARVLWETDEEMSENNPMSTITRERAAGIAKGEKCYTHDDVVELASIALASLEAEPVAWRHFQETPTDGGYWILNDCKPNCSGVEPLYTAPPAPVSVPDEMTPKQASRSYCGEVRGYRDGWNACRAAMLQGADGNYPVIPDELIRRIAFNLVYLAADEKLRSDEDSLFDLVRCGIDEVRRELAAPQQEVK